MPTRLLQFNAATTATKILASAKQHSSTWMKSPSICSSLGIELDTTDLLQRHNMALGETRQSKRKRDNAGPSSAVLDLVVESPPLLSYSNVDESSNAWFSGQFHVNVLSDSTTFATLEVQLFCITTTKKPGAHHHCKECGGTKRELKTWSFAGKSTATTTLSQGNHNYPFSYLFTGDLPASIRCHYAMIDYQFVATAKTQTGEVITCNHLVHLQRAIRPDGEKELLRRFPPTSMTATIRHQSVCYLTSKFPVFLRLAGIKTSRPLTETRWQLKRILWRIEEHQKIALSCPTYRTKFSNQYDHVKTIGKGEVARNQTPWKTDMQTGEIETSFTVSIDTEHQDQCIPDTCADEIQLHVSHSLIIDMVVSEEILQKKYSPSISPTGCVRLLRSQIPLRISNHSGAGVAWDEETPPVYQDVPASPPGYTEPETAPPELFADD